MKHYKKMNPNYYDALKPMVMFKGVSIRKVHQLTGVSAYTLGLVKRTNNYEEYVVKMRERHAKQLTKKLNEVAGEQPNLGVVPTTDPVKLVLHDDLGEIQELLNGILQGLAEIKDLLNKPKKGWWA